MILLCSTDTSRFSCSCSFCSRELHYTRTQNASATIAYIASRELSNWHSNSTVQREHFQWPLLWYVFVCVLHRHQCIHICTMNRLEDKGDSLLTDQQGNQSTLGISARLRDGEGGRACGKTGGLAKIGPDRLGVSVCDFKSIGILKDIRA